MMSVQELDELLTRVKRTQYAASIVLGGITYVLARRAFKSWPWPVKILMFGLIANGYFTISEQVKQWYIQKKTEEAVANVTQNIKQEVQNLAGKAQTLLSGLSLPFGGGGGGSVVDAVDPNQQTPEQPADQAQIDQSF